MANYFAENIKILRKACDLTQAEMLAALDIKRTTWNGYENGTSQPYMSVLIKIAEYFGIYVSALVDIDLREESNLIEKIAEVKRRLKSNPNSNLTGNLMPKKEGVFTQFLNQEGPKKTGSEECKACTEKDQKIAELNIQIKAITKALIDAQQRLEKKNPQKNDSG